MATEDLRASTVLLKPLPPPGGLPYYLYVPSFQVALDTALKNNAVIGYVAQLRQHGAALFTNTWQYARRPQEKPNGSELWTPDVQMHVASVSKLMTAMAMMVLFLDHKLERAPIIQRRGPIIQSLHPSWDAAISTYLPDYWQKGPNIGNITFLNLLQHTSGLSTPPTPVNFQSIQSAIAAGSNGLGTYNYQNVNYALCRILLPVIDGDIDQSADPSIWDNKTQTAYATYLQAKVFQPSSVVGATLDAQPKFALAYRGDPADTEPGWDSGGNPGGNLAEFCGCDGWYLSVNQLLDVMGEFRRGGGILPSVDAQAMLDIGFGVDPLTTNSAPLPAALPTPAGNVYCKPGDWHNDNGQDLQTLAYFLPEDMELAVFVNSTVKGLNATQNPTNLFRCLVTQTYLDNLTTQPPINK
jgi:hypothetical protein